MDEKCLIKIENNTNKFKRITISELFNLIPRERRFVLKGPPGAGKTITLLQIASNLLNKKKQLIPIFKNI